MTAEQFCLRWNNHQSTLVSVFDGLFESGTLVDCTLAADGQYLKAHKVVLSACSPYLEALLSQHYNQHPILILKDVKFEELKAMLEYMYRGEVNVTQEQLGRFLKAAETLQIRGLTNSDVGQGAAQILSSATTAGAGDNSRDVVVKTRRREAAPTSWPRSPPLTGNEASLVETLKLTPSKLVIDIPPISPVNSIREEESSMSPQPRKRRRRNRSQNDDALSRGSGSAANSDSKSPAGVGGSAFDVEPVVMLDASAVKTEMESQQANDDDYYKEDDSEGELVMDEDFDTESKPGPSNGSSGIAECGPWHGITRDGDPESAKGDTRRSSPPDRPGSGSWPEHSLFPVASMTLCASPASANNSMASLLPASEKKYTCGNCGKSYMLASSLYTHEKYQCGKEPQFKCPYCPHKTKLKGNLKAHIGFKHADMPRPF